MWDFDSELSEKSQNCEIKSRNYLFIFIIPGRNQRFNVFKNTVCVTQAVHMIASIMWRMNLHWSRATTFGISFRDIASVFCWEGESFLRAYLIDRMKCYSDEMLYHLIRSVKAGLKSLQVEVWQRVREALMNLCHRICVCVIIYNISNWESSDIWIWSTLLLTLRYVRDNQPNVN